MEKKLNKQIENIIATISNMEVKRKLREFFMKDVPSFNYAIGVLERESNIKHHFSKKDCARVIRYTDNLMTKAQAIEEMINERATLKKIKETFREQIKDFIAASYLMYRGLHKPSGHPGDYQLIEAFYDHKPLSEGVGYGGDAYILQDSYVQAIRIRKDIMRKELLSFLRKSNKDNLRIMNLGCGSCREIWELFDHTHIKKTLLFTLIDWDKEALDFAQNVLSKYAQKAVFKSVRENIVDFYRHQKKYTELFGQQDLIYSIGLADYLPDLIFGQLIKFCFDLLQDKGTLIIAHKNIKVCKSIGSDWACDWYFWPRTKDETKKIIDEALEGNICRKIISEEKTKHLFFIKIYKG